MELRDLELVDASVSRTATFGEAVSALWAAQAPALAVLDEQRRVVGVIAESDVLRAVFPRYLAELHHTSFLPDDATGLHERAERARHEPVGEYARAPVVLDAGESQTHAAEMFLHTGDPALPVVEKERFLGMLSVSALCHARLDPGTKGS
ncbi:MAG: CBS domain-containing protein [Thermoleophilia bacterium]|nr:CBS domain-containing protein [Thermoleophilia bacterium]MDH4346490.1 CBS domain-containing protein [Thermoleophilia bacterium]